jgi:benzylsuccinate CoA-transferase BbsE subunit
VAAYGGQSGYAASLFAAVAASIALLERERTGRGGWIDVSAQACVAQALEDAVATFDLTGAVRRRLGGEPREAGTGIYACADGYVSMVAGRLGTARAWRSLVAWLVEEGTPGAEELQAPEWSDHPFRQTEEATARFGRVFARFAGARTREQLYHEAQARGIALSPVNDIAAVLADPQLASRDFFTTVDDPVLTGPATYPGPPYRLSATPARAARPAPVSGANGRELWVDELGLDAAEVASQAEAGVA